MVVAWLNRLMQCFLFKYYTLSRTVLHHLLRCFVPFCSFIFELAFTLNLTKSATRCKEGIENLVKKKAISNYLF